MVPKRDLWNQQHVLHTRTLGWWGNARNSEVGVSNLCLTIRTCGQKQITVLLKMSEGENLIVMDSRIKYAMTFILEEKASFEIK